MSALWTTADAAAACGGRATGDWVAGGISIDSRTLERGDLFVALTDRRDGHDFVADALARGAAAAMVARRPGDVAADAPLLIVDDVQSGLEALGRAGRARTRARVIGVTGSVGKTSTKEMLRAALAPFGTVHAAHRSFNNHWGVPLTLARCPTDAAFAAVEIGMNQPGEIAPLASQASPDVAIVTAVAPAHLEAFDDGLPGIAREKGAIFSGLAPGGTAILNADLDTTPILRAAALGASNVVSFGVSADADLRVGDIATDAVQTRFRLHVGGRAMQVSLASPGRHFALNAAAALAAVRALGCDLDIAIAGLADWCPPEGRGTRETVRSIAGTFDLIDDSYNANPASVAAALDTLAAAPAPSGRRVAILGDMLELGPGELALHAALADHPAMARIDIVHAAGPRMRALIDALPRDRRGLWAETAESLAVEDLVRPGDLVLVKGSHGSRIDRVVAALRASGRPDANSAEGTPRCSTG